MEHKTKTIIGEDNNEPPKNYLWVKSDGKVYEFNYTDRKGEKSKMISSTNTGDGGEVIPTDDPVMRIISIVKEGNYTYASKGTLSPESWEEFSSGPITETVGQYSEDTPNIVYFVFPGESESDDANIIAFLLSDDDYALVPTTIPSEDEEDSTSYVNVWVNDATGGDYTSVEDVPIAESQGYYEGWSLASGRQYNIVSCSSGPYTIKDTTVDLVLGFNATWQGNII